MATIKNKFLAGVYVIFSLLLTWKTNFMFMSFLNIFTDTLVQSLFWIGYVIMFVVLVVLMPYRIATANQEIDIGKATQGIFWFLSGYVASIIITYIYTVIGSTTPMLEGEVGLIMWFGYYVCVVLITVVVPWYVTMPEGA